MFLINIDNHAISSELQKHRRRSNCSKAFLKQWTELIELISSQNLKLIILICLFAVCIATRICQDLSPKTMEKSINARKRYFPACLLRKTPSNKISKIGRFRPHQLKSRLRGCINPSNLPLTKSPSLALILNAIVYIYPKFPFYFSKNANLP